MRLGVAAAVVDGALVRGDVAVDDVVVVAPLPQQQPLGPKLPGDRERHLESVVPAVPSRRRRYDRGP